MWELDYKEGWAQKNWCFWTVALEKTLGSPLDCKEIQPVHPKGNWSWVFTGRTDVKAETPVFWPPDAKSWLIWKRPWRRERLKAGEEGDDRGWWLDGITNSTNMSLREAWHAAVHGVAKSRYMTEWLNWTEILKRVEFLDWSIYKLLMGIAKLSSIEGNLHTIATMHKTACLPAHSHQVPYSCWGQVTEATSKNFYSAFLWLLVRSIFLSFI